MPKTVITLAGRQQIADATWSFRFGLGGHPLPYRPGQTVDLTLLDPPHSDAAGNRRTFSLAGAPSADGLLVATRVRGSAFKRSLLEMPLGTELELEGPFGSFTLPSRAAEVVMLAGGIGVTPFRAMVEGTLMRSREHSSLLIHSSRTPEEAPFLDEFTRWSQESSRFEYRPIMTQLERSRGKWDGDRGRVDARFLAHVLAQSRTAPLFYVAGPERFVKGVVEALKNLGVDEDRLRFEEFPGY